MRFYTFIVVVLNTISLLVGCSPRAPTSSEIRCTSRGGILVGARYPYESCIKREVFIDISKE